MSQFLTPSNAEYPIEFSRPSILVLGATGAQGGSVARALLKSNHYTVCCLTRNPLSEKALALREEGAVIVAGDLDDKESLLAAMEGCYGVFGLTNFWEHFDKEWQQGRNLAEAALATGVKHLIYSGLPGYNRLSNGRYSVPHCDIKAELEQYIKDLGVPASFVHIAFYYENFFDFFPPRKGADGSYYFGFSQGNTPLAMASAEDMGAIVALMFGNPALYLGKTVGIVGEDRTCTEYAAIMSRVLGRTIRYNYIPRDVFAQLGFPGAEELANMFEVQRLHIPHRRGDLLNCYHMNPRMQSFEVWLQRNKHKFFQEELTTRAELLAQ
ncbi:MAG TPA: NmrA/HSCARG family protein [Puia sp.]|nr:NmrA/HSCARG family protein [Puia sp.]